MEKVQISKRYLLVGVAAFSVILVVSIIATYFGKSCSNTELDDNQLNRQCKPYMCRNPSFFQEWADECPTTPVKTTTPMPAVDVRLPDDLVPIWYDLEIKPYVGPNESYGEKAFTFEGWIDMHFNCAKPTNKIVFHQKDLHLKFGNFSSPNDPDLKIEPKFIFDPKKDFVTLYFNKNCKQNANYSLGIKFEGVILDKLYGFYRSSFEDKNKKKHYLATTKFQPTYARRAFPCFDEPALKAEFSLRIIRPKTHVSFSNNPIADTQPYDSDWEIDFYNRTVPMSTYLVAYVIAEFKSISKTTDKDVLVEVAARPEAIDNGEGDFGLEEAAKIIDFFVDYFDVPYPLPKSTQISIPDFNSGAMENWGLIAYRETSLLYNNVTDTIANKRRVSLVVSHELAHQWFGNLVTMRWWNDLWLNEGFASWVEYLGLNHSHPEWRDLDYFFVSELGPFVQDSLESSHPISVEVNDPNEITSLFDGISYGKGASIIRMMNAFLTENTFKKGVTQYLKKHEFSNAEQNDLWEALTDQAKQDGTLDKDLTVKLIMDTWTLRKGYPVVTVERNYSENKLVLTQKWFLLNPENGIQNTSEYKDYQWYVPFTFTTKSEKNFNFENRPIWLKPNEGKNEINLNNTDEWYIGNLQHAGFYRLNYDQENWNRLIKQLEEDHSVINPINRAQILDDTYNLGRAELIDQTVFLNITKYLKNEQDPLPFTAALYGLNYISTMLQSDFFISSKFENYYKSLIKPNYDKNEWNETEDANELSLQLSITNLMCKFGDNGCVYKAWEFFNDWKTNGKQIPSNFKTIVYQTIAKNANDSTWIEMLEIAKNTSENSERLRILRSLTHTQNYNLLKYILSLSYDESVVRRQDMTSIIIDVANNPIGKRMAFDFIDEKWDDLLKKFGDISFTLANLVKNSFKNFNTEFELNSLKNFQQKHPDLGIAVNAFKESLETVSSNKRWMDSYQKSITNWLN